MTAGHDGETSSKDCQESAKDIAARLATLDSLLEKHSITSEEYATQRERMLAEV